MPELKRYRAFGLRIASELTLPGLRDGWDGAAGPELLIEWGDGDWSGADRPPVWRSRFPDGRVVVAELGSSGDQRLQYGEDATFHITPAADAVRCRARDPEDPAWLRFLLDTVLWWVCLTTGAHVLHASAVSIAGRVCAFAGRTGGGKTSLAAALIRNGHALFSDDVLVLRREPGAVLASPGPPLMNLPLAAGDVSALGSPLAEFASQDETWIRVERSADAPAPLSALFLLERRAGLDLHVEPFQATALDLVPFAWGLPHATDARSQFELLSDLTAAAPIYQLFAGLEHNPGMLAAQVESAILRSRDERRREPQPRSLR